MILWLPPLLWTGVIALLSSPALGGETSGLLLRSLLPWAGPATLDTLDFLLRKGSHITEYAVLAALWDRAFRRGTAWPGRAVATAVCSVSLGTASLDEIRQAWVGGRTGSLLDVLLDGAASGLTEWGLARQAGGGSFTWSVTGAMAWTGAGLGTLLLALNWRLALPVGGLALSSAAAWALLLARRRWRSSLTHPNRLG